MDAFHEHADLGLAFRRLAMPDTFNIGVKLLASIIEEDNTWGNEGVAKSELRDQDPSTSGVAC